MQKLTRVIVASFLVLQVLGDAEDILVPGQSYPDTEQVDKDALSACLAAWGALLGVIFLKLTRGWAIDMTPCIHGLSDRIPLWCWFGREASKREARRLQSDEDSGSELSSEEMVILDIDYPLPLDPSPQVADRRGENGVLYDYFCLAPKDLHPSQLGAQVPNRKRLSTVMEEALEEPVLETRRLNKKLALFWEPLPIPCSPLPAPGHTISATTVTSSRTESSDVTKGVLTRSSSSDNDKENTFISSFIRPPPSSPSSTVDPLAGIAKWPAWLSPTQKPPETSRRLWPLQALPGPGIGEPISSPWFSQSELSSYVIDR